MLESSVKNAISVNSQFSNICGFGRTWKSAGWVPVGDFGG